MSLVSLVVPIYNEEEIIAPLHEQVLSAMEVLGTDWEVIYVDDGSRDRSLELLLQHQKSDPRITVVELSRNWGHQPALTAGLAVARGEAVVMMDGDLQDPPAVIHEFVNAWREGSQVVIGERRSRAETGLRRLLIPLFYKALGYLSDFPIPMNAGIFGLLDRCVVDQVLRLSESNRYLPGLRAWVGFRNRVVFYDRAARAGGEPKQTWFRLLRYGLDAIFSFSYKPLRLSLLFGVMVALLATAIGIFLIVCRLLKVGLFGNPVVAGYTSIIVSVLFLSGIQLFCVGILGEYIGRVYDEVKRRPIYIVNTVHRDEARDATGRIRSTGASR